MRCNKLVVGQLVVVGALLSLAGCSGGPTTYPVKGKVVLKGGKPWPGGRITFQSVADTSITATGDIQKDGTFTVETHFVTGNKARTNPGAVEGEHHVMVDPAELPVVNGVIQISPVVVAKKYTVKPGDNDFVVEVEKAGR